TPQSHRPTCQTIPVLSPHSFLFSFSVIRPPPRSPLFPYTTLFRSQVDLATTEALAAQVGPERLLVSESGIYEPADIQRLRQAGRSEEHTSELSHVKISYAVFCLKKKKMLRITIITNAKTAIDKINQ